MDLNKLKALAAAASPGPWRGDRIDGTVKYSLLDANDNAIVNGDNGNSGHGPYGIVEKNDEEYLMAAHPAAVLELIALTERLESELKAERDEHLTTHRKLAGETLRADQGWTRYEEANADRNALRAKRATAQPAPTDAGQAQAAAPDQRIAEKVESWRAEIDRLTDLIAHATGAAAPDAQPDLHAAIMNLPCNYSGDANFRRAFHEGHRAARHAAAELAAAQPEAKATPAVAALSGELKAAVQAIYDEFKAGAKPFTVDEVLDQIESDGVQVGVSASMFRDLFNALAAASNSQGQAAQPEQQPVAKINTRDLVDIALGVLSNWPDVSSLDECSTNKLCKELQTAFDAAPVPAAAPEPLQGSLPKEGA